MEKTRKNKVFLFSTKAKTLENLKDLLKKSKIPKFIYFTADDWHKKKNSVVKKIKECFKGKIVIRSSALNEDSYKSSMAGKYESVLNVNPQKTNEIINSANTVLKSYLKDGKPNKNNQILVQEQIKNVQMCGVAFTRDIETGAPYYVVNYDDYSGRTDIITSGIGNQHKIFTYSKLYSRKPSDIYLRKIIDCIREIEDGTKCDALDIEFVISGDVFYTLQVRPLVGMKEISFSLSDFKKSLENVKKMINEHNIPFPNLSGKNVAFGIMPDWNPAEIIGIDPKPLAFSLYRYLITDDVWPLSRQLVGYKNIGYHPGICSLAGKPYVDIRMSFNTFVPATLEENITEKLIDFYLAKLRRYQDFHDKVEFKVVYTCYQLDFDAVENELRRNGFFREEIQKIKKSLFLLTDKILRQEAASIEDEMKLAEIMEERRNKIINSQIPVAAKIAKLGHDCKTYGTLPFSKLARFAFISSALMRSLVRKGIITQKEYDAFFGSIKTVATEFLESLGELKEEKIHREEFLSKYGHLRPGTYDICSYTYRERFEDYIDLEKFIPPVKSSKPFVFKPKTKKRIAQELKSHGFSISADLFLNFVVDSTVGREKVKFEFTKNLSLMLKYIEEFCSQNRISREDAAFLNFRDILEISHSSLFHDSIKKFKKEIAENKRKYSMIRMIKLPPLIFLDRSVEYFRSTDTTPNFITQKTVCAEVVDLSSNTKDLNLNGKIALIENADPGYDWIFSHNLAGLITEFGGAASHMAIRAAEFKLPAAIGCGPILFNLVKGCNKLELNCSSKQVKIIL